MNQKIVLEVVPWVDYKASRGWTKEAKKEGWDKEQLEIFTIGALRRAVKDGDVNEGSLMAGLVVNQINEKKPLKDILEGLYNEYLEEKKKFYEGYENR